MSEPSERALALAMKLCNWPMPDALMRQNAAEIDKHFPGYDRLLVAAKAASAGLNVLICDHRFSGSEGVLAMQKVLRTALRAAEGGE